MELLCKFSNIFGKPNEGLHQYRIFDVAIVDVVLTFVGAYILFILLNNIFNTSYYIYVIVLFLVGVVMHRLFCVRTTVDRALFDK